MARSNFNELINSSKPVLIDFYADWCAPCQQMAPILHNLKTEMGEKAQILKIDVDKNQAVAAKFGIRSIPTLMVFKEGNQVWRHSGLATQRELKQTLEKYT